SGATSFCGDGRVDEANGETCDEGANLNGVYGHCGADCRSEASHCGDGVVDTENGEVCDRGFANGMTDCVYGELECILCSEECQEVSGFATYCGDGAVQANEVCDKAEPAVGEGGGIGAYCDDICQEILGSCGDGILQYNEVCDNAEPEVGRGEGISAYCNFTCDEVIGACGDGILQSNEACDNAEPEIGVGHGIGSRCDETCSSVLTKVLCTGQTRCSDGESYIDCPTEGEPLYGQDGQYAGKESCQPHEFTKGETLEIEENIYYEQVYDAATGLHWLVTPSQATYEEAKALCENPEGYGGREWRLPTIKELNTIVHLDISYPAVREAFFNFDYSSYEFWSDTLIPGAYASSIGKNRDDNIMVLDFGSGEISFKDKTAEGSVYHVICVNGEEYGATGFFTDPNTGLSWSRPVGPRQRKGAVKYCENLVQGGYDDWRIPTLDELRTLVRNCPEGGCEENFDGIYSALNDSATLWSSTLTDVDDTIALNVLDFSTATPVLITESLDYYSTELRCVRSDNYPSAVVTTEFPYHDANSGLWWSGKSFVSSASGYESAENYCEGLSQSNYGGISDWSVPLIEEYETLLDCELHTLTTEIGVAFQRCSEEISFSSSRSIFGDTENFVSASIYNFGDPISADVFFSGLIDFSTGENGVLVHQTDSLIDTMAFVASGQNDVASDLFVRCVGFEDACAGDNPCAGVANSDGTCVTYRRGGYTCGCDEGYFWNGSECATPITLGNICTGQNKCYNNSGSSDDGDITCPAEGGEFYGQDSQYAALGKCTPQSFTVRKFAGDSIVFDNNTGLQWQRDFPKEGITWDDAAAYCANLTYGGKTGWRLPDIDELRTLIQSCAGTQTGGSCGITAECLSFSDCWNSQDCDSCSSNSTGGHSKFRDTDELWSSSVLSDYSDRRWGVDFGKGNLVSLVQNYYHVRCVRQPEPIQFPYTDEANGLVWSSMSEDGLNWSGAAEYCGTLNEGGSDNWRVPTIAELSTLVEGCPQGSCDPLPVGGYSIFGDSGALWSSDYTMENSINSAIFTVFDFGTASRTELPYTDATAAEIRVRCVRSTSDPLARPQVELPYLQEYSEGGQTVNIYWSEKSRITTYAEAEAYCETRAQSNYGGISGWTVPDFDSLMLLLESAGNSENFLMGERGVFNDFGAFVSSSSQEEGTHLYMDFTSFGFIMGADDGSGMINAFTEEPYEGNVYVRCVYFDICENNPCQGIENGDGTCEEVETNMSLSGTTFSCGCIDGYEWDGSACVLSFPYTDSETHLVWSSLAADTMNWESAGSYCENLTEGGYTDWRLPNIDELRTLIQNCANTQTGGACAVSDPDHLAESDWLIDDCMCDDNIEGGYYSKLGDDDNA
ncbi:MAG: DUF1566 domain-containing protein, partial [Lachnospiraceae bacterium]|nr:DUF1566 domain-containing protein [Lachnospiraceae bacterium]